MKKRHHLAVKLSMALVLIAAISIFATSRWNVWFGNPPEPPYSVPNKISHLLMTYGNNGEESRSFSWICGDSLQKSSLELVILSDTVHIEAEGQVFKSRSGVGAYYNATINSLPNGIDYSYRVLHEKDTTEWYNFTIPLQNSSRSFIYIGDVQDNFTGMATRLFEEIFSLYPDVDFVLFGGDIIERPMAQYWDYWFKAMGNIPATKPIVAVAGNHEYLKGFPPKLEERFGFVFPYASANLNNGNALFATTIGNAKLYLLDSNKEFYTYFYQRRWLKREFENSSSTWNIVALHHPVYSMKGKSNNILHRMAFNPVIKRNSADLVLQGHEHAYMRTTAYDDNDNIKTPVYITSHCSPKNYRIGFSGFEQRLGGGDCYYQVISYNSESLSCKTYNSKHDLYDNIVISRDKNVTDLATDIDEEITITPDITAKPKKAEKYRQEINKYLNNKNTE